MEENKTAIIIGAGPAGLTAAYKFLKDSNIHPIVIEKESLVGGISRTVNHHGNRIDIGGHRFFTKNRDVEEIWNIIMPIQGAASIDDRLLNVDKPLNKYGPDPGKVDNVFLIRNRISRILYSRKFFDYPISINYKTIANLGFLNTFKAGTSYVWSAMFKNKEVTLEDFMINRFGVNLYKMFFREYTAKVWGRYPKEISAAWGVQRIKGLSLFKAIISYVTKPFRRNVLNDNKVETSLIEQFRYPKKGPGQFWERMAEFVTNNGGELIINSKVNRLIFENGRIKGISYISNGILKEITADYVFSTMPICDLIKAMNTEIPNEVIEIATKLPYRDFITVGLLVNKLKIENTTKIKTISGIVPDCWIYVQEPDVKIGRIQIFNNWSPYMVKDFENTVWMGLEYFCNEGDEFWKMSDDALIEFAIDEVTKIGIIDKNDVLDKIRINVEKAYPAYFGTYDQFDVVKNYLNSIENLFCIGRNGQHRYNNMDHSMLTALEAVNSVLFGGNKDVIWDVNTEANYHE